jgi:hypothetical protein
LPISSTDIEWRLSGGSSNTIPANSTGGNMSTVAGGIITTDVLNNLFDNVSGPEATSGDTNVRLIYIKNNHGSITFIDVKIFISQLTASSGDEVDLALDPAPPGSNSTINTTEGVVPGGLTFDPRPVDVASARVIGNMTAGQQQGIWIKRTVQPGAAAFASNWFELSVAGETT